MVSQNSHCSKESISQGTGNINAPEAVTYSAIIYCLRSLISEDIPLNQGCLKPIDVRIPKKSFLSPSDKAAVVGGNVLTVNTPLFYMLECDTDSLDRVNVSQM